MQSGHQLYQSTSAVSVHISCICSFLNRQSQQSTRRALWGRRDDVISNIYMQRRALCTQMYGITVRFGFDSRPVNVRFTADRVALGKAFLTVLRFSPGSITPPLLTLHSFIHSYIHPSIHRYSQHRLYIILATVSVTKAFLSPPYPANKSTR
jgi:hypothetical protein